MKNLDSIINKYQDMERTKDNVDAELQEELDNIKRMLAIHLEMENKDYAPKVELDLTDLQIIQVSVKNLIIDLSMIKNIQEFFAKNIIGSQKTYKLNNFAVDYKYEKYTTLFFNGFIPCNYDEEYNETIDGEKITRLTGIDLNGKEKELIRAADKPKGTFVPKTMDEISRELEYHGTERDNPTTKTKASLRDFHNGNVNFGEWILGRHDD